MHRFLCGGSILVFVRRLRSYFRILAAQWPHALLSAAVLNFAATPSQSQDFSVSAQQLAFRILEGGPRPADSRVAVSSARPWKVTTSDADVANPNPAAGNGAGAFAVLPVTYRKPGSYVATLTVTDDQNVRRAISVKLTVLARASPKVTYPAGKAVGCTDVPDLPPGNAAVCVAPDENPPGNFVPPPLGASYTDPNFGGRIRVIAGPSAIHGYSTPSPVSAANRYALVSRDGETQLTDISTGKAVKKLAIGTEGTMWDGADESIAYALDGTTIRRWNVVNGRSKVVADYGRAPHRFQSISSGGTGEISRDNWISFFAPREHRICALDVGASKTYCGAYPAGVEIDYTNMSKGVDRASGLRYVILIPKDGSAFYLYGVNRAEGTLDMAGRGPEAVFMDGGNHDGICDKGEPCVNGGHSDTTEDSAGNQWLMMGLEEQSPCGYSIYSFQLNKGAQMGIPVEMGGGLKRIMQLFRCGGPDVWTDYHLGCAKAAAACVVSTTVQPYNRARDPLDRTPLRRTAHLGEIMVIQDNGAEIRRLAQHRSVQFNNEESKGYWSTPRAAISADGSLVVATSNFGFPNQRRVIAIETGLAPAAAPLR